MTLDGSGLKAGKVIPVRVTDPDADRHRRALAEAINHVAAAAYTPITQIGAIEDVDLDDSEADLGILISVTPYVPARAHALLVFQLTNGSAVTDGEATIYLYENGTIIAEATQLVAASGGGTYQSLVLQALRDLEPNTTYLYTVTGLETPAGNILVGEYSSLSVRVEHRMLT
jgi:hypothetical protein